MRSVSFGSARRAGIFVASRWSHCSSLAGRRGATSGGGTGVVVAVDAAAPGQCPPRRPPRGASAASLASPRCPGVSTLSLLLARGRSPSSEAGGGAGKRKASSASASKTSTPATSAPFSLYDHPRLYDAAFAFRDFDAEAEFLLECWRSHSEVDGESDLPTSFLDVGCGTGRHGAALARAVSSSSPSPRSLSLYALDSSDAMLSAAEANAEEAGCPLKAKIRADFTRGGLEGIEGGVDVALCALGTLAHCVPRGGGEDEEDPALVALGNVSSALRPGGLLVLELPAAGDLFDGTLLAGDAWDAAPEGGGEEEEDGEEEEPRPRKIGQIVKKRPRKVKRSKPLIIEYGSPDDDFDPVTQVLMRTVVVSEAEEASGGDDSPVGVGREVGRETVAQRVFTPAEVRLLARQAGFRVAAELGDMEVDGPTAREGDRYVAVLVKKR